MLNILVHWAQLKQWMCVQNILRRRASLINMVVKSTYPTSYSLWITHSKYWQRFWKYTFSCTFCVVALEFIELCSLLWHNCFDLDWESVALVVWLPEWMYASESMTVITKQKEYCVDFFFEVSTNVDLFFFFYIIISGAVDFWISNKPDKMEVLWGYQNSSTRWWCSKFFWYHIPNTPLFSGFVAS